jgi:hypothetical protein
VIEIDRVSKLRSPTDRLDHYGIAHLGGLDSAALSRLIDAHTALRDAERMLEPSTVGA